MLLKSANMIQHVATRYSITFLLFGSVSLSSALFAAQNTAKISSKNAFLPIFTAEFALKRGDSNKALNMYQELVQTYNVPNINERALEVAIQYDDQTALNIAKIWVQHYPTDIPALFYLAHLSLKTAQYDLTAQTLDRIIAIDPNADVGGILEGIFPESNQDRLAMLQALNKIKKKNNPSLLVMLAGLEAQSGDFTSALRKVNLALKQRPNVPSFIILKANLYFASNQSEKALQWLNQNSLKQETPDVGLFEIQYLIKQNQTEQALKKLQQMLKKWHNNEQLLFLAGISSIDLKRYEYAEQYLRALQNSNNYKDQANYYLAINAERSRDYIQAIDLYKLVEGNLYTASRKNLVGLYLKVQNSTDAIRFLTQERVSHPAQSSFLYQLQAQILTQIGEKQRAIHLLDEALQQMPDDPEILYSQVLLFDPYRDADRLDSALNKLLEIEPNSPTFLNAYAYILAQQNRKLDLARQYAEQALVYAPEQASILDTLGYIAFLQNDLDTAVQVLARAYQLSPSLSIGIRYAKSLYIHGDLDKFQQLYQVLSQKYPHAPEIAELQQLLLPQTHAQTVKISL